MTHSWQKRSLFTARTVLVVLQGLIIVTWRRWRRGPQLPGWTWLFEWVTFVSPVHADLKGLPPIYIQAGDAEILIDMINLFVEKAQEQNAAILLETWKAMNHVFQAYGPLVPQAVEALKRLGSLLQLSRTLKVNRALCKTAYCSIM